MPQRNPVRLAARRRKRRIILGTIAFLLFAALFGGLLYVIHLPMFSIQSVEVYGAHAVSDTAIKKYVETVLDDGHLHVIPRRFIFSYPQMSITAGLREQFPRLNTVTVSRPALFSTALDVAVSERIPYGVWCTDGAVACYDIDSSGFVYAPLDLATSTGYVAFSGGVLKPESPIGLYVTPDYFDQAKEFVAGMSAAGFAVQSFSMLSDKDFEVILASGLKVRGSFDYQADDMVANLTAAMGANTLQNKLASLDYIDLRFGNRVYFKFK